MRIYVILQNETGEPSGWQIATVTLPTTLEGAQKLAQTYLQYYHNNGNTHVSIGVATLSVLEQL